MCAAVGNKKFRHVLLTGPPGIGKTTLVKKCSEILQKQGVSSQGFYTEEVREGQHRKGFDVVTLDGKRGPLARVSPDGGGRQPRVGQYAVQLQQFEALALPVITAKDLDEGILVLDEIGKMELFSERFKQGVRAAFNNLKTTVFATIPIPKGRPLPLVEELRGRQDVKIVTVDRTNRDALVMEVVNMLLTAKQR